MRKVEEDGLGRTCSWAANLKKEERDTQRLTEFVHVVAKDTLAVCHVSHNAAYGLAFTFNCTKRKFGKSC